MRIRKTILFPLLTSILIPISFGVTLLLNHSQAVIASRTYPTYQLQFDHSNPLVDSSYQSGNKTYKTSLGNDITFSYSDISYLSDEFAVIEEDTSFIKNTSIISGLVSVDYVLSSGSINISYGWSVDNYENQSSSLSNSGTYLFNQEYPSYFKIFSLERTIITSLTIKYSCVESVNPYTDLSPANNPNSPHQYAQKEFVDFPVYTDMDVTPGLTYTLSEDGTYYIVDNRNNSMEIGDNNFIVFPNEHNGLPVEEIGYRGFVGRWWIFGIYVPENIKRIQNEAFEMTGLTSVYWNARHCEDFEARNAIFYPEDDHDHQNIDLVFGPSVEHIPARMMYPTAMDPTKLPRIHSVNFSKNSIVQSIGDYAFYGMNNISSISLPDSIRSIGDYAFYNAGFSEIDLPDSLESIGDFAFMFSSASYISFPSSLSILGEGAFNYSSIIDLDLSHTSLANIPISAFAHSENLNYISLPSNLLSIDEEAFYDCESLISIYLPDLLTSIGLRAFKGCLACRYIYLGRDLSLIKESAFEGLINVSTLVIRSTHISDLASNNKVFLSLGSNVNDLLVYFKLGVEVIPAKLFYPSALQDRLPNIQKVVLPISLTEIHDYAFYELDILLVEYYGNIDQYDSLTIGEHNSGLAKVKARGI